MIFRRVRHVLVSIIALAGASLALACGSAPTEGVGSSEDPLINPKSCPIGWTKDCSNDGNKGQLLCGPCYPEDGVLSVTQVMQPPSVSTPDGSSLDTSPHPYPPELRGMGCTATAIYHNSTGDTTGARVWFCPVGWLTVPPQIQPLPLAPLAQKLVPGETFTSHSVGSPVAGYVALGETIQPAHCLAYSPTPQPDCLIGHGCSGTCSPSLTP